MLRKKEHFWSSAEQQSYWQAWGLCFYCGSRDYWISSYFMVSVSTSPHPVLLASYSPILYSYLLIYFYFCLFILYLSIFNLSIFFLRFSYSNSLVSCPPTHLYLLVVIVWHHLITFFGILLGGDDVITIPYGLIPRPIFD